MQTIIENEKKLSYYYRDRLMVAMSIFCAFLGVALFFEGIFLVPLLLFGASAALLKFGYEKQNFTLMLNYERFQVSEHRLPLWKSGALLFPIFKA